MLPPKEGTETYQICPVIGCGKNMIVAYREEKNYMYPIFKCPGCETELESGEKLIPTLSTKSLGKCPLKDGEMTWESKCSVCKRKTASFIDPEKWKGAKSREEAPCCQSLTCYVDLLKILEKENKSL